MENNRETFSYTYSAKEQDEVQKIRNKYLPKEPSKMEQLRQLDQSVTQKGTAASVSLGVLGALILGVGMCCCMVWMGAWFVPGIIIGLLGIVLVALAYPMYTRVTKKEREKIAPEILKLTEELMK